MGSGKSTVGGLLSSELGWPLVDTDALVEQRAGRSIPELFRALGEPAFRQMESEALASLTARRQVVVATGGGAPAQPRNRAFFPGDGTVPQAVFHLRVSLETARQRAGVKPGRPLLELEEPALHRLYESRQAIYESLGIGVETEGKTPQQIAGEIIARIRNPSRPPSAPSGDSGRPAASG